MARIKLPTNDELPEAERSRIAKAEARGADTSVQRALALRADMFDRYFAFYNEAHTGGIIEPELKELVRLKIARLNDCFT